MKNFLVMKKDEKNPSDEGGNRPFRLVETKNWYKDRYQIVVVQRNVLVIFTIVALIGLVGLVINVAALSNSKIFEPFVIQLDEKTGIVTKVDTKSVEKLTALESVTRAQLSQYVMARESYSFHSYFHNYHRVVRVLSSDNVYEDFRFSIARGAQDSPLNLQNSATRRTKIKSITFLDKQTAQVRIAVDEISYPRGELLHSRHYILTMSFEFDPSRGLSPQERYLNPLGFKITGYSRETEFVQ